MSPTEKARQAADEANAKKATIKLSGKEYPVSSDSVPTTTPSETPKSGEGNAKEIRKKDIFGEGEPESD